MNEHKRAVQKQYRIDHKEEISAKKKLYYLAHKDHIREYQLACKAKRTTDEIALGKEKGMTYYMEHKQIINERLRVRRLPGILHRAMLKEFRSKYAPWNEGVQPGIYQHDFEECEIASCWLDAKKPRGQDDFQC